ncbi:MAG: rhomboid family intramembrane serine protease [Isosphaeraceae bacterium]
MGIYDREYYRGEPREGGWFNGLAPVCRSLIVINVVVFLLERLRFIDGDFLHTWFAASSQGIFEQGRVWQLLTATFLHGDPLHLVGNMLFLWFVGRELEAMYGSRDFLAFYLCAAVFSTFIWATMDLLAPPRGLPTQMVGASGGVLAMVVLYALYYPRREILFMFVLPIQMWVLVAAFIAYQVFLLLNDRVTTTAVESHLAGAAFGFLYKRFDLRWSRMPWNRSRRPRFRVVSAEPREAPATRPTTATWSSDPGAAARPAPSSTAVVTEEQLDARLDEVLAKIAREGRGNLSEEDQRVLQEASLRARNRRSERL